ncbi:MAG: hydrolase [Clostridiales bacterium]|nr:hydrolase [Clostridiales bacterium]
MGFCTEFNNIFKQYIKRNGADQLYTWIAGTDFFTAPASTRFHAAYEGGLLEHSLNVFHNLVARYPEGGGYEVESLAICGLLHDLCKVEFYKVSTRNVKNEAKGCWEKVPFYIIDERFPYGHGEKSVFLIERFMSLTAEEALAIRWHMGGFDSDAKAGGYSISAAFSKCPLAVMLHIADLEATYLTEVQNNGV